MLVFLSVGSHFTSLARASSLHFSLDAVQIVVMFCLKGRELYLIRQLRVVLLFGLHKVLVESLVPANGMVEHFQLLLLLLRFEHSLFFPWNKLTSIFSSW